MSSPYAPPGAPVRDPAAAKGSLWKAVLAGIAIDTGGTLVASVVLSMLYGMSLAGSGAGAQELEKAMANIPITSWVSIAGMVIGCSLSVAGGYVCARIARHAEYRAGAIVAVVGVVVGFVFGSGNASAGLHLLLNIASIVATFAGVWLGIRRNARG